MKFNNLLYLLWLSTPINKIYNYDKHLEDRKYKYEYKYELINSNDIDIIMSEISANFHIISTLKLDKKNISKIINDNMINLSKNKTLLKYHQINKFKLHNDISKNCTLSIINIENKLIDKQEFLNISSEILNYTPDLNTIYKKLLDILNHQMNIISKLYKSIFHLNCALSIFG